MRAKAQACAKAISSLVNLISRLFSRLWACGDPRIISGSEAARASRTTASEMTSPAAARSNISSRTSSGFLGEHVKGAQRQIP
jgi:hypothetical protein